MFIGFLKRGLKCIVCFAIIVCWGLSIGLGIMILHMVFVLGVTLKALTQLQCQLEKMNERA